MIEGAELGTPEVVSARPGSGFLSGPTKNRPEMLRSFLSNYSDAYGISARQVEGLELIADYVNPAGNMAWVEFQQRLNGLPVVSGIDPRWIYSQRRTGPNYRPHRADFGQSITRSFA